eukprot:scaffold208419_cov24-Tisochrysis_lutea.AAC.4
MRRPTYCGIGRAAVRSRTWVLALAHGPAKAGASKQPAGHEAAALRPTVHELTPAAPAAATRAARERHERHERWALLRSKQRLDLA